MFRLTHQMAFPPVELASKDGLLCIGGDLSPQRLLRAYARGIFPWYSQGTPIVWWAPDPRAVLPLDAVHVPRRLARRLRTHPFTITVNRVFPEVIRQCARVHQPQGETGWLLPEMVAAYTLLHRLGYAHSFEAWSADGRLVGGLYGVGIGRAFFGESMFHTESDASRAALLGLVAFLRQRGCTLLDCQQHTENMARMGCIEIPRTAFMAALAEALQPREGADPFAPWNTHCTYDTAAGCWMPAAQG